MVYRAPQGAGVVGHEKFNGHVERLGPRRPKMTWNFFLNDRHYTAGDPHERNTWRSGVRSTMHAASQLS